MSKRILTALLVATSLAAAEETKVSLTWRTRVDNVSPTRSLTLFEKAPMGVTLPAKKDARFARIPFGDGSFLTFVFAGDEFWFDRDLDDDLAEERPQSWRRAKERRFRTIHVQLTYAGESHQADIQLYLLRVDGDGGPKVTLQVQTQRHGRVVIEGRERRILLVDANADLRFNGPEDRIYFDLDGSGTLRLGDKSHERVIPGRPFGLKGHGYVALVTAPSGREVVLRPAPTAPPPTPRRWIALVAPPGGLRAQGIGDFKKLQAQYKDATRLQGSETDRSRIVQRIGDTGVPQAGAFILNVYRSDKSPIVKAAAVRALGFKNYEHLASWLATVGRKAREKDVQIAAMEALHGMGAPQREHVYAAVFLRTKSARVCEVAAKHLALVGSETARRALHDGASKLSRKDHRFYAYYYGTRYSEEPPPAELMRKAALAPDPRLHGLALKDLHALGRPEARTLALQRARGKVESDDVATILLEILAIAGDAETVAAIPPLAKGRHSTILRRLRKHLRPMRDPGGLRALAEELAAEESEMRYIAATVLARTGDPMIVEPMAARLSKEHDPRVLLALVRGLGVFPDPRGTQALVSAARKHKDNEALRRAVLRVFAGKALAHKHVRAFVREMLTYGFWQERVLAMDAAVRSGEIVYARWIIKNLDHEHETVRLAAVQSLGTLRVKEAIAVLIDRLEAEGKKRVRQAIPRTLMRVTGVTFHDSVALWREWWQESRDTFSVPPETPRLLPKRPRSRFYGLPVESERVVFVVDESGSMAGGKTGGSKLARAISEVKGATSLLAADARVNVIFFQSGIEAWRDNLVPLKPNNRKALRYFLNDREAEGGTNLYDALDMALRMKDVDTICLLSDGEPNMGKYTEPEDILKYTLALNEFRRITIHCVSVGQDSRLLSKLAAGTGGRYRRR